MGPSSAAAAVGSRSMCCLKAVLRRPSPELWKFSLGPALPREQSDLPGADSLAVFPSNSAVGACDACRGFGRVIGVDWGLVILTKSSTLRTGVIKPIQTPAWKEIQDDGCAIPRPRAFHRDTAWSKLTQAQKDWVIEGSPNWNGKWSQTWYGIRRFFEYLESKAYKMHIRVLLCPEVPQLYRYPTCGARLKTESLLWRIGGKAGCGCRVAARRRGGRYQRFMPQAVGWSREQLESLPGLCCMT